MKGRCFLCYEEDEELAVFCAEEAHGYCLQCCKEGLDALFSPLKDRLRNVSSTRPCPSCRRPWTLQVCLQQVAERAAAHPEVDSAPLLAHLLQLPAQLQARRAEVDQEYGRPFAPPAARCSAAAAGASPLERFLELLKAPAETPDALLHQAEPLARELLPGLEGAASFRCPSCGVALSPEYDGCDALRCVNPVCGTAICGVCFRAAGHDAHEHVRLFHGGNLYTASVTLRERVASMRAEAVCRFLSHEARHPLLVVLVLLQAAPLLHEVLFGDPALLFWEHAIWSYQGQVLLSSEQLTQLALRAVARAVAHHPPELAVFAAAAASFAAVHVTWGSAAPLNFSFSPRLGEHSADRSLRNRSLWHLARARMCLCVLKRGRRRVVEGFSEGLLQQAVQRRTVWRPLTCSSARSFLEAATISLHALFQPLLAPEVCTLPLSRERFKELADADFDDVAETLRDLVAVCSAQGVEGYCRRQALDQLTSFLRSTSDPAPPASWHRLGLVFTDASARCGAESLLLAARFHALGAAPVFSRGANGAGAVVLCALRPANEEVQFAHLRVLVHAARLVDEQGAMCKDAKAALELLAPSLAVEWFLMCQMLALCAGCTSSTSRCLDVLNSPRTRLDDVSLKRALHDGDLSALLALCDVLVAPATQAMRASPAGGPLQWASQSRGGRLPAEFLALLMAWSVVLAAVRVGCADQDQQLAVQQKVDALHARLWTELYEPCICDPLKRHQTLEEHETSSSGVAAVGATLLASAAFLRYVTVNASSRRQSPPAPFSRRLLERSQASMDQVRLFIRGKDVRHALLFVSAYTCNSTHPPLLVHYLSLLLCELAQESWWAPSTLADPRTGLFSEYGVWEFKFAHRHICQTAFFLPAPLVMHPLLRQALLKWLPSMIHDQAREFPRCSVPPVYAFKQKDSASLRHWLQHECLSAVRGESDLETQEFVRLALTARYCMQRACFETFAASVVSMMEAPTDPLELRAEADRDGNKERCESLLRLRAELLEYLEDFSALFGSAHLPALYASCARVQALLQRCGPRRGVPVYFWTEGRATARELIAAAPPGRFSALLNQYSDGLRVLCPLLSARASPLVAPEAASSEPEAQRALQTRCAERLLANWSPATALSLLDAWSAAGRALFRSAFGDCAHANLAHALHDSVLLPEGLISLQEATEKKAQAYASSSVVARSGVVVSPARCLSSQEQLQELIASAPLGLASLSAAEAGLARAHCASGLERPSLFQLLFFCEYASLQESARRLLLQRLVAEGVAPGRASELHVAVDLPALLAGVLSGAPAGWDGPLGQSVSGALQFVAELAALPRPPLNYRVRAVPLEEVSGALVAVLNAVQTLPQATRSAFAWLSALETVQLAALGSPADRRGRAAPPPPQGTTSVDDVFWLLQQKSVYAQAQLPPLVMHGVHCLAGLAGQLVSDGTSLYPQSVYLPLLKALDPLGAVLDAALVAREPEPALRARCKALEELLLIGSNFPCHPMTSVPTLRAALQLLDALCALEGLEHATGAQLQTISWCIVQVDRLAPTDQERARWKRHLNAHTQPLFAYCQPLQRLYRYLLQSDGVREPEPALLGGCAQCDASLRAESADGGDAVAHRERVKRPRTPCEFDEAPSAPAASAAECEEEKEPSTLLDAIWNEMRPSSPKRAREEQSSS